MEQQHTDHRIAGGAPRSRAGLAPSRRRWGIASLAATLLAALVALVPATPPAGAAPNAPARIGERGSIELVVTGRGGVPASGVGAVALNVAVTNPSSSSFLTVWPTGGAMPLASNLNFVAGQTVPNMVIAKVGAGGRISLFNYAGSVDVVVDVMGWFPEGDGYVGLTPARLLDTRESSSVGERGSIELVVTGRGGVPASGVGAVALNVAVTNPSSSSFLTVWPTGGAMPLASNLNFVAGQTVPNMVIAKVGAGGRISLFNYAGSVDVVVDVMGWFPEGDGYVGLTPARLLDTRESSSVGERGSIELVVTGRGGVPASGVGAVALNVAVTNPSSSSFLTVWPTGGAMPLASNLNFVAGQTVPNMVIAKVGAGGRISLFNSAGSVDVVVDVMGWFPEGDGYVGLTPARLLDTRESVPPTTAPPTTTPPTTTPPPTQPPTPPLDALLPGAWDDIPAGRYVMEEAQADCYWERFGFIGVVMVQLGLSYQFHDGRTVVDIAGHESFWFGPECGPMRPLVASGSPASVIPRGTHVVGLHVRPGTYRVVIDEEQAGCGWTTLSSFSGGPAAVTDAMAISDIGEAFVTISSSDVGFETDCGPWVRVG